MESSKEHSEKPTGIREEGGPQERDTGRDPHHALNNPAVDPDPTEYPDPYEKRPDPRDPDNPDPAAAAQPSTSEEPPPRNFAELKGYSDKHGTDDLDESAG